VVELNVGAVRVVRFQNLPHDQKEIRQSTLLQCLSDRHAPVPFAEMVRLNVRMRDILGSGRRVGITGQHLVAERITRVGPTEFDLKGTVDIFPDYADYFLNNPALAG
jgi:hypothetical protein